ncbi:MAG TPA: hypothetical protein VFM25_14685, partial [Verrucomicrobiae bacterium]|nr:hypothetical protein [Verrucomicrobiae bacterium]
MSWKQNIREFQDKQENLGWRIQKIPYDDASKPKVVFNGIATVGAILFIFGFVLAFNAVTPHHLPIDFTTRNGKEIGLMFAVMGLLLAFFGTWFKARRKRKGWELVNARCVDRELKKIHLVVNSGDGSHGSWGWFWRMICEYEYHGQTYRVTPEIQWINFTSEAAAMKFFEEKVSPSGECKL